MEATDYAYSNEYHAGMTIRDKLAESAMIGLLSCGAFILNPGAVEIESIAKQSYKLADALIAESNK
jgi:hypothetical protein